MVPPPPKPTRPALPKTFALTPQVPDGFPDYRTTGSSVVRLDLEPARWDLSRVTLPPKIEARAKDEQVLEHKELPNPKNKPRILKILTVDLPFTVTTDEQTFKPEGMDILVDGKVVPFSRTPAPQATTASWRMNKNGRQVILAYPTIPEQGAVLVKSDRARLAIERHDPRRYEGKEEEFVHTSLTLSGETRHGLQMVAPSSGEWTVTLPGRGATFSSWLTLEASPLDRPKSDGATLLLSVVEEGKTVEAGRTDVSEVGAFSPWTVDLSRWAGKSVSLRLECVPNENANFDWVFVGSPVITGPPGGDVRRVVVVALDTTRPDHTSFYGYDRATPELDEFASSAVTFDESWSTAPRTRPSFRSSTTGRLPLEAVGAENIGHVFRRHDFVTAGIVANVHLQPRFDFDDGFDWWRFDGKARAEDQVDTALDWLLDNQDRDAYLFLHFMDPHMPYDAPGEFRDKYVTATDPMVKPRIERAEVLQLMRQDKVTDVAKEQLRALHDGEMAYLSTQLGRFFDEVDKLPGKTLVVLHSDHGEEFWDHERFEHNHSLYDELVRTLFVVRPGGGITPGRRVTEPVTLMDLAPTLYDLLGFEDAPVTDGRSLVPELGGSPGPARPIPVGYLQYSHERWGVVWEGKKYILHTGTGLEELYDLEADPDEKNDLAPTTDLKPWRDQLAEAHKIEVEPGLRVFVGVERGSQPIELTLPATATDADVLDPETVVEYRANVEWGENPKRLPQDIGRVELSSDKRTVTFHPGPQPRDGVLYVTFDEPVDAAAVTASRGGKPLPVTGTALHPETHKCLGELCVVAGTIVVPPLTEAQRMGIGPKAQDDDIRQLCELGYMEGEECERVMQGLPASDDDRGGGGGGFDPEHPPEEGGAEGEGEAGG